MKHTVYLGLGSNIGDRIEFLASAIRGIADIEATVVDDVSNVYETEPVGDVPQAPFLNLCISVRTDANITDFHRTIKALEKSIGRTDTVRWGPREIDIDVLLFDHCVHHDTALTVPHREIVNRRFVLQPLSEIAPQYIHPTEHKSIVELLNAITDTHAIVYSESFTTQLIALINDSITNPTV